MQDEDKRPAEPALVSNRTMEIVVALILLAFSGVVAFDSVRVGSGWQEGVGPAPGYFPFYIALILAGASTAILLAAIFRNNGDRSIFVSRPAIGRVLTVFLPSVAFVALIEFIGIYVAAALFIAGFMMTFGKEPVWKSLAVGIGVPIALFFMFERWFLVPLPKGPLEAMLGFG